MLRSVGDRSVEHFRHLLVVAQGERSGSGAIVQRKERDKLLRLEGGVLQVLRIGVVYSSLTLKGVGDLCVNWDFASGTE